MIDPFVYSGPLAFTSRWLTGTAEKTASGDLVYGGQGLAKVAAWAGKVVLLDRGGNTFWEKLSNVRDSGGLGLIIANNVAGPANEGSLGTGNTSTIPVVAVSQADGASLKVKAGSAVTLKGPNVPPASVVLPDPTGRAGDILASDGTKLIFRKPADVWAQIGVSAEQTAGKPVSFSVTTSGAPPFTFQWSHNGATIAGANAPVLLLPSVRPADAGTYVCVVSGALGVAPSAVCTLTVK